MRVLITGATGFVGTALTEQVSSFYDTIVLVRTQNNVLSSNIQQLVAANIFEADLPNNIDVIIHLAGRAHILNEQTTDPLNEFRKVNVDGTLQLARQALEKKVKLYSILVENMDMLYRPVDLGLFMDKLYYDIRKAVI